MSLKAEFFSLHGNVCFLGSADIFPCYASVCIDFVAFLCRSPDTSRVRSKMIYASSKDRFKRELDGIQIELQATDPTEMGLDVFKSRAN